MPWSGIPTLHHSHVPVSFHMNSHTCYDHIDYPMPGRYITWISSLSLMSHGTSLSIAYIEEKLMVVDVLFIIRIPTWLYSKEFGITVFALNCTVKIWYSLKISYSYFRFI